MKLIYASMAVLLCAASITPASAWTPEGEACLTRLGYQTADWEAIRVPPGPAAKVRKCLAQVKAKHEAARKKGGM